MTKATKIRTLRRPPANGAIWRSAVIGGIVAALLAAGSPAARAQPAAPVADYLYAGTWNNIAGVDGAFPGGVYGWKFDRSSGAFTSLGLVASTLLSSDTLTASPDGRFLFVSQYNGCICTRSWPFPGSATAGVASYSIDRNTGKLTFVNQVDGLGDMPSELTVDATGRTLAISNYYGGNVVTFPISPDGRIGAAASNFHSEGTGNKESAGPHPHGLVFSPDNRSLYVADQGLDRLYSYSFDPATSKLTPAPKPFLQFPSGDGPRHIAISPTGQWVYINTEQSGMLRTLAVNADGGFTELQGVPLQPPGTKNMNSTAWSKVSPDSRFVYINSRPNENTGIYAVDPKLGTLTAIAFPSTGMRAVDPDLPPIVPFDQKTLWERVESGSREWSWDQTSTAVAYPLLNSNSVLVLRRDVASGAIGTPGIVLPVPQPAFAIFVRP